ncbi:MAG: hypothetical protein U0531_17855 [Dehalococcoidia bacterium]
MAATHLDHLHDHAAMYAGVRPEYSPDGRLHRHRVLDGSAAASYTTWAHNSPHHAHRMNNGGWTRPRRMLSWPRTAVEASAG